MACSRKCISTRRGGRIRASRTLGLVLLAGTFVAPAGAQQPPPKRDEPAQIAVRVELVNLDVTVTDARGNFVRDLKRENFRVLDQGAAQPVTYFESVEAPAQVLVLVETSPAVYLIHKQHLAAAYLLLEGLAPDDMVALASYDSEARLQAPFTQDKRALQAQIEGLHYNLGRSQLNLFGSLAAALDWLAAAPGKKSVVLLTTGLDDGPAPRGEALLEKLRGSSAAIYPVALGGELRDPPKKNAAADPDAIRAAESFERASRYLQTMADVTGGRAFFPREPSEFATIYRQIATILRHTYRLGFTPPARDGRFHRVYVQLLGERGRVLGPFYADLPPEEKPKGKGGLFPKQVRYRLYFRRGYLAPEP